MTGVPVVEVQHVMDRDVLVARATWPDGHYAEAQLARWGPEPYAGRVLKVIRSLYLQVRDGTALGKARAESLLNGPRWCDDATESLRLPGADQGAAREDG